MNIVDESVVRDTAVPAPWEALPPAQPAAMATGHAVRNVLVVTGISLLLIAVGGAFVVTSRAAVRTRLDAASAVLKGVDQHRSDISSKVATVVGGAGSLKGTDFDAAKAKSLADQASAQMDALKTSDTADIAKVQAADGRVKDRSLLTTFASKDLDSSHGRLAAYHRALVVEIGEIDSAKQQLTVVSDLMTTLVQLKSLANDLNSTDLTAAEKDLAAPSLTLNEVISEADLYVDTPSKLKDFLRIFRSELTHIKGILDGARDNSASEIESARLGLNVDLNRLDKFDIAGMQQQYVDLGMQYDARMRAELDKAK